MANLLCAGLLFLFFGGDVYVCSRAAPGPGPGRLAGLISRNRSLAARAVRALLRGAGRVWRAVSGTLGRMWRALTAIDLRDPAEKTLLRLLAVNFAIVTFICCFWFLGIAGTVIYTVVLVLPAAPPRQPHPAGLRGPAGRRPAHGRRRPGHACGGRHGPVRPAEGRIEPGARGL